MRIYGIRYAIDMDILDSENGSKALIGLGARTVSIWTSHSSNAESLSVVVFIRCESCIISSRFCCKVYLVHLGYFDQPLWKSSSTNYYNKNTK